MDARILATLRAATPEWVSSEVLRQHEEVSRMTISKRIRSLQALGYRIESRPSKGYRLLEEPTELDAEDLRLHLSSSTFYQHPFHLKQETGSTNDDLRALAGEGAPEGTVIFSERQLQGRGRRGRVWFAPAGEALQFSVLLRPPIAPGQGTLIPLLTAAAVYRALTALGVPDVGIKWPNDVLIDGKKVCGVLCEMSVSLEGIDYALLGIGLNVTTSTEQFPEELREIACSLASATGKNWNRKEVWVAVLNELETLIRALWNGNRAEILEAWRAGAVTPGQLVDVMLANGSTVTGQATGVTEDGALRLILPDGKEQIFHSGEVSVRPNSL